MGIRSSLFAKILVWFFMNLVLVGLLIWMVYKFQIGPASPFLGQSEDRIRSAAIAVEGDLLDTPRAEWPVLLREHENRFGNQVKFHLLGVNRQVVTGGPVEFPEKVLDKVPAGLDQPSSSLRLTENRYRELNATADQITDIMAARREYFQARNQLNLELRQRGLDQEALSTESRARRQELEKKLLSVLQGTSEENS